MPHIRALFIDNKETRHAIRTYKRRIRTAVAEATEYSLREITLFSEVIPSDQADLTENMMPLELVINVGTRCAGKTEKIAAHIKKVLIEEAHWFETNHFGIWLCTMTDNSFVEHVPKVFYAGDPCSPDDPNTASYILDDIQRS